MAAVAAAALYGVEDSSDFAGQLLESRIVLRHSGVVLLHPGENLPDVLPVLITLALELGKLVVVPRDHLTQFPDHHGYCTNVASEGVKLRAHRIEAGRHLGKSSSSFSRLLAEEPCEPLKRQAVR
jgi:hypothetical protein